METYQHVMIKWLPNINNAGPILESKGMYAIFQKQSKTNSKKGQVRQKYMKIWAKYTKFPNILKKGR